MAVFFYKAKKENAESVSGEITASSSEEAIDILVKKGLLPISVDERAAQGGLVRDLKPSVVRLKEIYSFTRQLTGLLRSGVPLLQALEILGRQTRDRYFARVLSDIQAGIRNGRSFSICLSEHPTVFSSLYVAMARAGEESGRFRELLASMVIYFRKQDELLSKVRMALAYPIFMLVVGTATVAFILAFVMPRISVLFSGMQTQLPWPTLFIMGVSQGIVKGWPVIAILVFILIIAARVMGQNYVWRKVLSRVIFTTPLLKDIAIKVDMERFSRTLGQLLASGIPILKALEVAIPTLSCDTLKKALWGVQESVTGGGGFGEALKESDVFPEMFAQLISVGEESGELSSSLNDIADAYEQEIAEITKTMTTLLEPLMILVVGAVIGFIVFAMLMPVFQMDIFAR